MKRIYAALAVLLILLVVVASPAVFPGAASTDADLLVARNSATTTLNGAINNSVTTFVLTSGTRFGNNMVETIDSEQIFCATLITNTDSGCTRGYGGTTAASHSNGATVSGFLVAAHHNSLADEIKAIESLLLGTPPASGITTLTLRGGASQGTTNILLFQENSNTYQGGVDPTDGLWTGTIAKRKVTLTPSAGQGFVASSDYGVSWRSADSLDTGSIDSGIYRNAAGVVEVNNGTLGTYRDLKLRQIYTGTNCADSAGAAACGSAAAGAFVVDAGSTSTVVSTTAVTANSEITVTFDASLGTRLSITCNAAVPPTFYVSARTAGTSFTLTSSAPVTNPACFAYAITN